jgi:dsRNA-specific ribonuclease
MFKLAISQNFDQHIIYGREMQKIAQSPSPHLNSEYVDMMEDVLEGFFGAISIISERKNMMGSGYAISYAIIEYYCNTIDISLRWEDVFDSVTRLKEIYDIMKWDFKNSLYIKPVSEGIRTVFYATLWGYPLGDRKPVPENKRIISKTSAPSEKEAKSRVTQQGLNILYREYGIQERITSPYEIVRKIKPSEKPEVSQNRILGQKSANSEIDNPYIEPLLPPLIPADFADFIGEMLKRARVRPLVIQELCSPENLLDFHQSFIHESYHHSYNYDLTKVLGVIALDLIVIEYSSRLFPQIDEERWLTRLKHTLVSNKKKIYEIAVELGFEKFVQYGEPVTSSLEKIPDRSQNTVYIKMVINVYKSFVGALMKIISQTRTRGVGYVVAYNFVTSSLKEMKMSTQYEEVFDDKSQLKELYDTFRWNFKQSIRIPYNEEKGVYECTIVGYPKGNRFRKPENEVILAQASSKIKKEAEHSAARAAIRKLDTVYNIQILHASAY